MASEFDQSSELRSEPFYLRKPDNPVLMEHIWWVLDDIKKLYNQLGDRAVSPLTTKGDLWVYGDTGNTRQAVGAARELPMADPASPTGLTYVNPITEFDLMTDLAVKHNDVAVGQRKVMNFIDGGGVTFTITDDAGDDEIEVQATVAAPADPDLDAVLTAGNDGGAQEITNIADGTAATSAATVGQVNALGIRYLDHTTTAVDGAVSTSEQILRATLIPANTVTGDATVEIEFEELRAASANNATYRVRLFTSAGAVGSAFSSGTIYYGITIPATTQAMRYFVRINFTGAASQFATNALVSFNSVSTGAGPTSSLAVNADMYIILTVQKTTDVQVWGYDFYQVKLIQP